MQEFHYVPSFSQIWGVEISEAVPEPGHTSRVLPTKFVIQQNLFY